MVSLVVGLGLSPPQPATQRPFTGLHPLPGLTSTALGSASDNTTPTELVIPGQAISGKTGILVFTVYLSVTPQPAFAVSRGAQSFTHLGRLDNWIDFVDVWWLPNALAGTTDILIDPTPTLVTISACACAITHVSDPLINFGPIQLTFEEFGDVSVCSQVINSGGIDTHCLGFIGTGEDNSAPLTRTETLLQDETLNPSLYAEIQTRVPNPAGPTDIDFGWTFSANAFRYGAAVIMDTVPSPIEGSGGYEALSYFGLIHPPTVPPR